MQLKSVQEDKSLDSTSPNG